MMEHGNNRGEVVVKAGATEANAIGFVSAGPLDGGIAGVMGGGDSAASTLMGNAAQRK
jgi:hypothetical protein